MRRFPEARPARPGARYAHGRRLGFITDADHRMVERARERALGLLQDRAGPFAGPWPSWAPDPAWPQPELPDGADRAATGTTE